MGTNLKNNAVSRLLLGPVSLSLRVIIYTLVFSFSLFSQASRADFPSFYGETFFLKRKQQADTRPPLKIPPTVDSTSQSSNAYQRQLSDIESTGGPYADGLAQLLLGLGRNHVSRGEYDKAIRLYGRALHNVRLNDGLYSERQAPFVRELLDTIRLSGDLSALDDRYDYFFRLYGSGQPPYTPLRMRATLEYLRWQREALRLGIDKQKDKRLLRLYQLNKDILSSTWATPSYLLADQWDLTLSQIRNLYLLLSIVEPRVVITGPGAGTMVSTVNSQDHSLDFDQRHLENILRAAMKRSEAVLEQYIAAAQAAQPTVSVRHRARAVLELADWYQWNGNKRRAGDTYTKVVKMLARAGQGELIQAWFDEPVELPDNGAFWQPPVAEPGAEPTVVTATFDVTATGKVRNITLGADDQGKFYRFKRELSNTRFRPRYVVDADYKVQGVFTEQLSRRYELLAKR